MLVAFSGVVEFDTLVAYDSLFCMKDVFHFNSLRAFVEWSISLKMLTNH